MKHILTRKWALGLVALGLMVGCSQQPGPQEVATSFLQCFFAGEFIEARQYATENLFPILDESEAIMQELDSVEQELVRSRLRTATVKVDAPAQKSYKGDTITLGYQVVFAEEEADAENAAALTLIKDKKQWRVYSLE